MRKALLTEKELNQIESLCNELPIKSTEIARAILATIGSCMYVEEAEQTEPKNPTKK